MNELRHRGGLDRIDPEDWAEIAATYHGMVSRLDDHFGRIQTALEQAAVLDRTVTCFMSDHGEYLGDYGLIEKWPSGLDGCLVRNPLIIAGPDIAEGRTIDGIIEMIDLLPTCCELADTEVDHPQFGRSLVDILGGRAGSTRQAAFSEGGFRIDEERQNEPLAAYPYDVKTTLLHEEPSLVGRAIAVRTEGWAYVYRSLEPDELYDRAADPGELQNVAGNPANASVVAEHRDLVLKWLVESSDVVPPERDPRMESTLVNEFMGEHPD
jgi:arylsulfatase A-like enzyme